VSAKLSYLLECSGARTLLVIIKRNALPDLNCHKLSPLFSSTYAASYLLWNWQRGVLCDRSCAGPGCNEK
jgi:hypothetical protein